MPRPDLKSALGHFLPIDRLLLGQAEHLAVDRRFDHQAIADDVRDHRGDRAGRDRRVAHQVARARAQIAQILQRVLVCAARPWPPVAHGAAIA
jgi:hypothetical protein